MGLKDADSNPGQPHDNDVFTWRSQCPVVAYETRSRADVHGLMRAVMDRVLADGWEPDVIICVERGGRVPAGMALERVNATCKTHAMLSRVRASKYDDRGDAMHGVRVEHTRVRPDGRVLVVDDVLETGDTIRAVMRELYGNNAPGDVRVAVPFKKSSYVRTDVRGRKVYYGEDVPDDVWIIPEWEKAAYRKAVGRRARP